MDNHEADNKSASTLSVAADRWPLSARDAAEVIGVNERTIRRAIARGDLIATRHAGVYRIGRAELERYLTHPGSRHATRPEPIPGSAAQLPNPLTALIGRESETRDITGLLRAGVRLVTLTGPGGVGKTRLAIEVAHALEADFPGGVFFIPLDTIRDAALVPPILAAAIDARFDPARPADSIATALQDRQTLLVLDNVEQVTAAAPFLAELIERTPWLHILITSRLLLRIPGERAFPLAPLTIDGDAWAVRLFSERAEALAPGFTLTDATTPVVTEICRMLDGLPLAIELAAARMSHLPVDALRDRLKHRLPLLTNRGAGPERHRTLRAAIAWSNDLLNEEERAAFRRLSVFSGGFTLDTAEHLLAIIGGVDRPQVPVVDLIASLVDASLLVHDRGSGGRSRYRLLDTIREFAAGELVSHGEEAESRRAHAAVFLAFAEPRTPEPYLAERGSLLAELGEEEANIQAGLTWLEAHGSSTDFARMVATLGSYLTARGHSYDGHRWFEAALSRRTGVAPEIRARIALAYSVSLLTRGNADAARQRAAEAVALMDEAGDQIFVTRALIVHGAASIALRDNAAAIDALETALARAGDAGDPRVRTGLEAAALANLGMARLELGMIDSAAAAYEAALIKQRAIGNTPTAALSLLALGEIARVQRDFSKAIDLQRTGLRLGQECGNIRVIVEGIDALASTAIDADPGSLVAIRMYAAADRIREQTGIVRLTGFEQERHETALAMLRPTLVTDEGASAWSAGRLLTLDQAVMDALQLAPDSPRIQRNLLSRREMDVLQYLAAGKPDREIAEALFVSVRTIEHHVASILAKLGVPSRTAAATTALIRGLVAPPPPEG